MELEDVYKELIKTGQDDLAVELDGCTGEVHCRLGDMIQKLDAVLGLTGTKGDTKWNE